MHRPIGTGGDPVPDFGDLLRGEAGSFRGHAFAFFGGKHADEDLAVIGFPGYERCRTGGEGSDGGISVGQTKVGFGVAAAVTLKTVLGENRLDF